jgi:hypothetical protein
MPLGKKRDIHESMMGASGCTKKASDWAESRQRFEVGTSYTQGRHISHKSIICLGYAVSQTICLLNTIELYDNYNNLFKQSQNIKTPKKIYIKIMLVMKLQNEIQYIFSLQLNNFLI